MNHTLLVGAGPMAVEHAKVLKHLGAEFTVVGRGQRSAESFEQATGIPIVVGGLAALTKSQASHVTHAIVAINVDASCEAAHALMRQGVKHLLLEKPAGLNAGEIRQLHRAAREHGTQVCIAYNRRHFPSVLRALEIAAEDGGITSINFEFTEWGHVIEPLSHPASLKAHWFLANSTHVVDTAFHLAGMPKELSAYVAGSLTWHPTAAAFAGAGLTEQGIPFSYQANWESAGRWGIEIHTRKRKLILRPMEALQEQLRGKLDVQPVELPVGDEAQFKPGLLRQALHFLRGDPDSMCSLEQHVAALTHYQRMAGYADA